MLIFIYKWRKKVPFSFRGRVGALGGEAARAPLAHCSDELSVQERVVARGTAVDAYMSLYVCMRLFSRRPSGGGLLVSFRPAHNNTVWLRVVQLSKKKKKRAADGKTRGWLPVPFSMSTPIQGFPFPP
jgi:hypothetical protein